MSNREVAPSVGSDVSRGRDSHQTLGPLVSRSEVLIVRSLLGQQQGESSSGR